MGCQLPQAKPPTAEFLVADGGSTFWVKSGPAGIHARLSPLILTRAGNRFYQVYVGEQNRSYEDATFSAEPIYKRDLTTGDSTVILDDQKIKAWETVYRSRHPSAQPVDPDDVSEDGVELSATSESDIVGVLGPYVLYTHRWTIQNSETSRADTVRGILDVRLDHEVPLSALMHDSASINDGSETHNGVISWHHAHYDVMAKFDAGRNQSEMMIKDSRGHTWKLGYVNSRVPRIYWLDEPRVDARVRTAISEAFEDALSDDDLSQLASLTRSHSSAVTRAQ
jgi:hypothetical protein